MAVSRLVLDTNVLVAGLRSRRGASFRLLSEIGTGRFELVVSVPLVLEYEDVLTRHAKELRLDRASRDAVLDFVCREARHQEVFFLWRPVLPDPGDDMVLELAVAAGCDRIVSFNRRHFAAAATFGLRVVTPGEFWQEVTSL